MFETLETKKTWLIKGEYPYYMQKTVYDIIKYLYCRDKKDIIMQDQAALYLDAMILQKIHEEIISKGVVFKREKYIAYSFEEFHKNHSVATMKMILRAVNRLLDCGLIIREVVPIVGVIPISIQDINKKRWYYRVDYDVLSKGLRIVQTLKAKGGAKRPTRYSPKKSGGRKKITPDYEF